MKTKTNCSRCGGSGSYSFNLKDGTVCYGCNGSGFQMIDLAARAKKQAATSARNASTAVRSELFGVVVEEMNARFGPFKLTNEYGDATPGYSELLTAVKRNTGKEVMDYVKERMVA